jgi:hypothetical protein
MDFGEILRIIRKRWYVMLPGLAVTAALTFAAYLVVPTKYQSNTSFSLINSPRPVTAQGYGNPFLTFESSLTATADFLARSLTATESVREVNALGVTEEYTAALSDNAMGPFITITVTGTDRAHVKRSTTVLAEYARAKLRQMQERSGAPESSMIQAVTIIEPQPPTSVIKTRVEVVAGTAGLMLALALVATFLTESVARARIRTARPTGELPIAFTHAADHARVWSTNQGADLRIPRPAHSAESGTHAQR